MNVPNDVDREDGSNQSEELDAGEIREIDTGGVNYETKVHFNPIEHHDKTASK